nr:hypothetical protein [Tanacetum cinerariifolium]
MSPSSLFMQTNSMLDDWGTKLSDSKNEFSLRTFSVMNKTDGSGGEEGVPVTKLTTSRLVNGSSCGGIDMVIKDLDLKPKVDAMMRDFLDPSRWKELSKEMSNKILPCGDGSSWKTFKPIRYHIVPFEELNGVPIALMARSGVISKSMDRIRVSHDDTSLINLESRKSPIAELFDVDSGRISIHH